MPKSRSPFTYAYRPLSYLASYVYNENGRWNRLKVESTCTIIVTNEHNCLNGLSTISHTLLHVKLRCLVRVHISYAYGILQV